MICFCFRGIRTHRLPPAIFWSFAVISLIAPNAGFGASAPSCGELKRCAQETGQVDLFTRSGQRVAGKLLFCGTGITIGADDGQRSLPCDSVLVMRKKGEAGAQFLLRAGIALKDAGSCDSGLVTLARAQEQGAPQDLALFHIADCLYRMKQYAAAVGANGQIAASEKRLMASALAQRAFLYKTVGLRQKADSAARDAARCAPFSSAADSARAIRPASPLMPDVKGQFVAGYLQKDLLAGSLPGIETRAETLAPRDSLSGELSNAAAAKLSWTFISNRAVRLSCAPSAQVRFPFTDNKEKFNVGADLVFSVPSRQALNGDLTFSYRFGQIREVDTIKNTDTLRTDAPSHALSLLYLKVHTSRTRSLVGMVGGAALLYPAQHRTGFYAYAFGSLLPVWRIGGDNLCVNLSGSAVFVSFPTQRMTSAPVRIYGSGFSEGALINGLTPLYTGPDATTRLACNDDFERRYLPDTILAHTFPLAGKTCGIVAPFANLAPAAELSLDWRIIGPLWFQLIPGATFLWYPDRYRWDNTTNAFRDRQSRVVLFHDLSSGKDYAASYQFDKDGNLIPDTYHALASYGKTRLDVRLRLRPQLRLRLPMAGTLSLYCLFESNRSTLDKTTPFPSDYTSVLPALEWRFQF